MEHDLIRHRLERRILCTESTAKSDTTLKRAKIWTENRGWMPVILPGQGEDQCKDKSMDPVDGIRSCLLCNGWAGKGGEG